MEKFVEKGFIGNGRFYLDGRRIGNASTAKISYTVEQKTLPNKQGGGGNLRTKEVISAVSLSMTITNMVSDNIAMALQAKSSNFPSALVTDEEVMAYKNGLASTATMIDLSVAVTVKDASDAVIAATDYEVTAAGIVLNDSVTHSDGEIIKVSYTSHQSAILQAALDLGKEFAVVLDGLNDDNGEPHVLKGWRWKPGPVSELTLISDDYGGFELTGELLVDTSRGNAQSQFFELHTATAT